MCLLIYKPGHVHSIPKEHLKIGFDKNQDGAGFMWVDKQRRGQRRLRINKGFMDFDQFYSSYSYWQNMCPDSPFVVHFRWSTRGLKTKLNCHPFKTYHGAGMAHNGVFQMPSITHPELTCTYFTHDNPPLDYESDTSYYARELFSRYAIPWFTPDHIKHTSEFIGTGNKVVLLDWKERVVILNEAQGEWDKGIWYSNTGYKYSYNSRSSSNQSYDDEDYDGVYYPGQTYRCSGTGSTHASTPPTKAVAASAPAPSTNALPQTQPTKPKPGETVRAYIRTPAGVLSSMAPECYCLSCKFPLTRDLVGVHQYCWQCPEPRVIVSQASAPTVAQLLGPDIEPSDETSVANRIADQIESAIHAAADRVVGQTDIEKEWRD
jgi:hypothetical protein